MKKRKICLIITSRIHYTRNKLLLDEIKNHPDLELQLIVGGSALLSKYESMVPILARDGFNINEKLYINLEGGDNIAMSITTGLAVIEFTTAFQKLDPDIVVLRADRFEMLAAALAAAYLNKTIAHIEGGDVSGSIDESVRHAITKLSHIHFVTNEKSKQRVLRLGENPDYVFNVGSLDVEYASKVPSANDFSILEEEGVGGKVNVNYPFIMVIQHPVTSEKDNFSHVKETLQAVYELKIPTLWFWPNIDAGTDDISHSIRQFREYFNPPFIRFIKYLSPEIFINLLKRTGCLVGNSSAGIKECSYLGTPVVNIGSRQNQRYEKEIMKHIIGVDYKKEEIKEALQKQIERGRYQPNLYYFQPDTSKKIVDILAKSNLYTQKTFYENKII